MSWELRVVKRVKHTNTTQPGGASLPSALCQAPWVSAVGVGAGSRPGIRAECTPRLRASPLKLPFPGSPPVLPAPVLVLLSGEACACHCHTVGLGSIPGQGAGLLRLCQSVIDCGHPWAGRGKHGFHQLRALLQRRGSSARG